MEVRTRKPEDRNQLKLLIRSERDAKQRDRYRALALALDGRRTNEIVEMLDRSRAFVKRWVYAYRDGRIEAIQIKKPGKKPLLPLQLNQYTFKCKKLIKRRKRRGESTSTILHFNSLQVIRHHCCLSTDECYQTKTNHDENGAIQDSVTDIHCWRKLSRSQ